MAAFFLDTSAVVKRYLAEVGSRWVQAPCHPSGGNDINVARITAVEVTSAVSRRRRSGTVTAPFARNVLARFRRDFRTDFAVIEIAPRVIAVATALASRYPLRAYDAVQLAAAFAVHAQRKSPPALPVPLVSSDVELNAAAIALGIPVDDPNTHP